MRARAAVAAAAILLLVPACRTAGPAATPADPERTARSVAAVFAAREKAWAPRRFKALYRGEVAPKVGLRVRGFLSLFWDGEALEWRASAPLAGSPRAGTIRRGDLDGGGLFPGPFGASDVLAVLRLVIRDALARDLGGSVITTTRERRRGVSLISNQADCRAIRGSAVPTDPA